jgi:hypothetical protein
MNSAAHNEVPSYHGEFADYQSGAVKKMRTIRGNKQLRSFLGLEIEVHSQTIESAFAGLKGERTANILNVVLPDDKLARTRIAVNSYSLLAPVIIGSTVV